MRIAARDRRKPLEFGTCALSPHPFFSMRMTALVMLAVLLCGCPQDQTLTLVAGLTKDRQTVEAYVKEVKAQLQPTDPKYVEARQRYLAAFTTYSGYITALKVSIQTGLTGDLQSLAAQAENSSNDFVTYVSDNLPQPRGLLSLLPQLSLAKIANAIISIRNNQRAQVADMVYSSVAWRDWDSIT